jgi:hypothetical protein
MNEEIKSRLNSGNACNHSVQSRLSSCLLSKNVKVKMSFIHFPVGSQLEHRAPFRVSVIAHTIRHMVGLLWASDQPGTETSTYTGQHNI